MKKNILLICVILTVWVFSSCKNNNIENNQIDDNIEIKTENKVSNSLEDKELISTYFINKSVDDKLAEKIKSYLINQFLTEGDLRAIKEDQRKFQLYKIDLNNDGNDEVFVNFGTSYFCGSGGCTVLLLKSSLELITRFSPTRTLYVENTFQNGWRVILTVSEGSWRKLIYNNGTYPSNPTMVETKSAPSSEQAEILFDEDIIGLKTYTF